MTLSLVSDGSGFIGLHLVSLLLEKGQKVHTTIRSLKNIPKCKPLLDLRSKYPGHLSLFEADLMKPNSFTQAMQDCTIIYHVASPFLVHSRSKTENVLESVNKCQTVQRVVLTSFIAAMYGDCIEIASRKDSTLSESCWNETSSTTNNLYRYSKVIAEREAWKMQQVQNRWDLVVINPGLVLGPSLSPGSSSGSLFMVENLFRGDNKMGCPELYFPIIDVRDVVEAHVRAGMNPVAKGGYIVAGDRSICLLEMTDLVRPVHQSPKVLPQCYLPKLLVYAVGPFIGVSMRRIAGNIGVRFKVDNSRSVRELGMSYRLEDEVVRGHYEDWVKSIGRR
ncbi:NAD(P)-binding protein [Aspergillus sclerotioniger CBS 115572]|uniref:NAD(P)-binding protein n=1 Tax=Aspergillus sclerotioniger CBS 115572 TaxID=1450535 RepID=A0A317VFV6_9EURO|nr:NAD(P)-binding protein [Aspergillus sclerotioniger CBS 115572]PWY71792.1 NAD(P)-binding protein [Aspergillus sclerotioniger CBS 115572]